MPSARPDSLTWSEVRSRTSARSRSAPRPGSISRQANGEEFAPAQDGNDAIELRDLRFFFQTPNQGKGAALRLGFAQATGEIVLLQDADLEYDPRDYARLLG